MVKSISELKEDAQLIIEGQDVDKIVALLKDNQKYRQRIHDLKEQIEQTKQSYEDKLKEVESKLPGDDVVVLPKQEAEFIKFVKETYGNFDLVKGMLSDYDNLKKAYEADRNRMNISRAARKYGFNEDALEKLFIKMGIKVDLEEDEAFVIDGDNKTKLDEYIESEFPEFIPSLKGTSKFPPQRIGIDSKPDSGIKESVKKRFNIPID